MAAVAEQVAYSYRAEEVQGSRAARETAQQTWAASPAPDRLALLRRARHGLASQQQALVEGLNHLPRTLADSLVAEVLPLLAACEFLEKNAVRLLASRRPPGRQPFWLRGVRARVERVSLGTVLIVAPSNYPLFLPGVQALQALAAGNAVVWKPGSGGMAAAQLFRSVLLQAGLAEELLLVTDESVAVVQRMLREGVDQVVFTGSSVTGRAVMALAAESGTPVVAELSGCDAVFVLPGADAGRVVEALAFGMRLNGSATCMAPRRLMLVGDHTSLLAQLRVRLAAMDPVPVTRATEQQLRALLAEAETSGAHVSGGMDEGWMRPVLVTEATAAMRLAQSDVFAPVISVQRFADEDAARRADAGCPYGLTAAVFGPEPEAERFARGLRVGTVLINDVIVPTADPRVPFGGRRSSGFGVTRGAEGLLAMTAPRTLLVRRGGNTRHLQPTGEAHGRLFAGVISGSHAASWKARLRGWQEVFGAIASLGGKPGRNKGSER